uniref:Uncharacterized protein n=1 Tax=Fagus sylvatica TaxID=28930 RepID=A0A2N9I3Z3_FAGSY
MSDFDVLGTVGKLALPTFARFRICGKSELGLVRYGPANRGHRGVFGPFEGSFPIGIPASPDKFLAIREFLVVHECVFFPTCPGSRINLLRVRKTLCASVATSVGKFRNFQQNLILSACFHARGRRSSRCRISDDLGTAKNLPQFTCHSLSDTLALNRLTHGSKVKVGFRFLVFSLNSTFPTSAFSFPSSSDLALRNCKSGGSTVWNLSPNKLRGDLTWGLPKLQIGWFQRFGISVQTAANRVVSTVWNLSPNRLRSDLTWGLPKLQIGWFNGLESQSKQLRSDLTWGLPKLQIGWFNGLESQSKQGDLRLQRSDLTWGLPKLQSGVVQRFGNLSPETTANRVVSTVWNLSPNRLRSDLTWGLPKLQIGWFNGLESQSKQVEDCKSGGSTVWNLSPNRLRSDLTWGLPKLQIGWFNGLESQSKQVEGCKSGGSTVWNLSPNKLRSDLTWGLPKLQIGWFNGLESQSKQVEGCKSGGSTVWNLSPNKLRGDLTWGLPKLQIGCLTEVVVAEIVAGPHALDSCECMNIEGAMRAPLRWLLLCLLGRSALASHTLGLAISTTLSQSSIRLVRSLRFFQSTFLDSGSPFLISGLSSNFSIRGKIAPVWYNKINEFLIPGLRYYHRFGRFCKRCPFAWMM